MAHALHTPNSQLLARHQDNMLASLARRLETARAANNAQLVELLERERQQIASESVHRDRARSLIAWVTALKQRVSQAKARRSELQVSHLVSGREEWWYAFDPQTGNCVYADSEAELRLWIKDHYQGK